MKLYCFSKEILWAKRLALLALLLTLVFSAALTEGEDLPSPKEFYIPGFVNGESSIIDSSVSSNSKKGNRVRNADGNATQPTDSSDIFTQPNLEKNVDNSQRNEGNDADEQKAGKLERPWDLTSGIQVNSLGLIVNAADPAHSQRYLRELLDTAQEFKIQIGEVYLVGGINSITKVKLPPPEWSAVTFTGGDLKLTLRPPKELEVTLSPTWVVATPNGTVLLEAVSSIDRYLNRKGELLSEVYKQ